MLTLDVGCGQRKLGDVNVDVVKSVSPDILADARYLPIKENVFKRVTAFEVIEHVGSPFLMLKEIHRVLIREGEVILSTPNPYLWRRLLRELVLKKPIIFHEHIICFTRNELENLARKVGFKEIDVIYRNPPWHKEYNVGSRFKFLDGFVPMKSIGKRHIIMSARTQT